MSCGLHVSSVTEIGFGSRDGGVDRLPKVRGSMGEHELLVFLVDVLLLVVVARVGAELAARVGLPLVVGELLLGICVGPTLLGRLWPRASLWLFPPSAVHHAVLDGLSWIGVLFLVAI